MGFDIRPYEGTPLSEPGIYSGVPMSVYHGPDLCVGPSISSSGLRTIFAKSARHYWAYSPYNPTRAEREESQSLILGQAAHHALLGEEGFWQRYVERPEEYEGAKWNSNRKDCRAWLDRQALAGKRVLTATQVEQIRGMAAGLAQDPLVQHGLLNGLIEHTIVLNDAETGVWIKIRPDSIPNHSGDFGDLKTTTAVDDESLQRTIETYGYHQQGALIARGAREVLGVFESFSLAFVEKDVPFCARTVTLKGGDLDLGARQNQAALRVFARGMKTGVWPGPGGTRSDGAFLGLKPWAIDQINYRLSEMNREEAA